MLAAVRDWFVRAAGDAVGVEHVGGREHAGWVEHGGTGCGVASDAGPLASFLTLGTRRLTPKRLDVVYPLVHAQQTEAHVCDRAMNKQACEQRSQVRHTFTPSTRVTSAKRVSGMNKTQET